MTKAIALASATAAALVAVAGCAVSIPKETFYTLSPIGAAAPSGTARPAAISGAAANATARPAPISVLVEPVRIPDLVDRPQMVVSIGDAEVVPLEQQRWAEPLRAQVARVLALDLAAALPSARVSTSDAVLDGVEPAHGFRVAVDVQRFETRPGESATIEAAWSVRRDSGELVGSGRERLREAATEGGYDGAVRAHNRGLAAVGRAIAAALRQALPGGN